MHSHIANREGSIRSPEMERENTADERAVISK